MVLMDLSLEVTDVTLRNGSPRLAHLSVVRAARRRALLALTTRPVEEGRLLRRRLGVSRRENPVSGFTSAGRPSGEREARPYPPQDERCPLSRRSGLVVAKALDGRLSRGA